MWRFLVIAMLLPASALAGETGNSVTTKNQTKYFTADAHCRDARGQRHELGEVICITASCLTWMAKCELALNNAIWRKTQEGCPSASLYDRFLGLKPAMSVAPAGAKPLPRSISSSQSG
jgi:hypothetical protein